MRMHWPKRQKNPKRDELCKGEDTSVSRVVGAQVLEGEKGQERCIRLHRVKLVKELKRPRSGTKLPGRSKLKMRASYPRIARN